MSRLSGNFPVSHVGHPAPGVYRVHTYIFYVTWDGKPPEVNVGDEWEGGGEACDGNFKYFPVRRWRASALYFNFFFFLAPRNTFSGRTYAHQYVHIRIYTFTWIRTDGVRTYERQDPVRRTAVLGRPSPGEWKATAPWGVKWSAGVTHPSPTYFQYHRYRL